MITLATKNDLEEISRIHYQYFKDEFSLADFIDPHTMRAWVVRNDNGKIISVGALKTLIEAVMITDKSFSPHERKDAFLQILHSMMLTCQDYEYYSLHAFVQNEKWKQHLGTVGFSPTKGESLVLSI